MMKVTLIQSTPNAVETIAQIASICYDSDPKDCMKLLNHLYKGATRLSKWAMSLTRMLDTSYPTPAQPLCICHATFENWSTWRMNGSAPEHSGKSGNWFEKCASWLIPTCSSCWYPSVRVAESSATALAEVRYDIS